MLLVLAVFSHTNKMYFICSKVVYYYFVCVPGAPSHDHEEGDHSDQKQKDEQEAHC